MFKIFDVILHPRHRAWMSVYWRCWIYLLEKITGNRIKLSGYELSASNHFSLDLTIPSRSEQLCTIYNSPHRKTEERWRLDHDHKHTNHDLKETRFWIGATVVWMGVKVSNCFIVEMFFFFKMKPSVWMFVSFKLSTNSFKHKSLT